MCGIIAISTKVGTSFSLNKSLEAIRHRGPDDAGIYISPSKDCYLAQARLSIIDLSKAGHQPMVDISKQYILSYNGEIYNFLNLKVYLESKYGQIKWQSTTDTEVILEGFAREGYSFLGKLNGIFAITLYDNQDNTLVVLRDPIGIKPLYFTEQNGSAFFCSELKGLLPFESLKRTLRHQSIADQLAFTYVPEPYTMFNEFHKLEPGVCKVYSEGKCIKSINLFEHLHAPISFSSEKEVIDTFYDTFSKAIERQLIADVPVSLFLSGGVDSSAIAQEVIKKGGKVKDAYTISFSNEDLKYDQQGNDLTYAKLIANKLGIELKVIQPKINVFETLKHLANYLDDAISDPSLINTYLICKAAREDGIKVMLSGQGADEYLGGYRRYVAQKIFNNLPSFSSYLFAGIGYLMPSTLPGRVNASFRRFKKFVESAAMSESDRLLSLYMWNTPERIKRLFINSSNIDVGQEHKKALQNDSSNDIIVKMLRIDQKYDLMSLNLSYTDQMSMAVGVEARVPFLDFDLVKVMNAIPTNLKIKNTTQKYVLKKAMEPHLPKDIIYRQKTGFGLPIRSWLRKENDIINFYFSKDRIEKQGIFNSSELAKMCQEQFTGKADHSYTILSMLVFQMWLDTHYN